MEREFEPGLRRRDWMSITSPELECSHEMEDHGSAVGPISHQKAESGGPDVLDERGEIGDMEVGITQTKISGGAGEPVFARLNEAKDRVSYYIRPNGIERIWSSEKTVYFDKYGKGDIKAVRKRIREVLELRLTVDRETSDNNGRKEPIFNTTRERHEGDDYAADNKLRRIFRTTKRKFYGIPELVDQITDDDLNLGATNVQLKENVIPDDRQRHNISELRKSQEAQAQMIINLNRTIHEQALEIAEKDRMIMMVVDKDNTISGLRKELAEAKKSPRRTAEGAERLQCSDHPGLDRDSASLGANTKPDVTIDSIVYKALEGANEGIYQMSRGNLVNREGYYCKLHSVLIPYYTFGNALGDEVSGILERVITVKNALGSELTITLSLTGGTVSDGLRTWMVAEVVEQVAKV